MNVFHAGAVPGATVTAQLLAPGSSASQVITTFTTKVKPDGSWQFGGDSELIGQDVAFNQYGFGGTVWQIAEPVAHGQLHTWTIVVPANTAGTPAQVTALPTANVPGPLLAAYVPVTPSTPPTIDLTTASPMIVKNGYLELVDQRGPTNAPQINLYGNAGAWVFAAIDVANAPASAHAVPLAKLGTYSFYDGATTSGSPTLTSTAQGQFTSVQVGKAISGPGIPNGTTVLSVQSASSLTLSANATATATGVTVTITDSSTYDQFFVNHGGGKPPTFGFGVTPPDLTAEVQVVVGLNSDLTRAGLRLVQGSGSSTGDYLRLVDSGNTTRLWFDNHAVLHGLNGSYGGALVIGADATNNRAISMLDNTAAYNYGFYYGGGGAFRLSNIGGGADIFEASGANWRHLGTGIAFFGGTAATKQAVTGALSTVTDPAAKAVLTSILAALATNYGLVTNSTT